MNCVNIRMHGATIRIAVGFMNVILLHSNRRDVSATRVANFRVLKFYCLNSELLNELCEYMCDVYVFGTLNRINSILKLHIKKFI
jgi:hypothetical protein